jgi:hypothetical protein
METTEDLKPMLDAYKAAVDEWITAIRSEEELASADLTEANVDKWEEAHFREEDARNKALAAKKDYEGAIRQRLFGF